MYEFQTHHNLSKSFRVSFFIFSWRFCFLVYNIFFGGGSFSPKAIKKRVHLRLAVLKWSHLFLVLFIWLSKGTSNI